MFRRSDLHRFLWAISQPRTFYVLGAGASYGLIPVTTDLRKVIETEYHSVGIYPAVRAPRSALYDRLIGKMAPYELDVRQQLLSHMPYGALDFLVQRALWLPKSAHTPPQYGLFEYVPAPATMFNFNLDGLASLHCGLRHIVLEPHGRIDDVWFERHDYQNLLEATVTYELRLPHLSRKLLPSPEPDGFALGRPYANARRLFQEARVLVIVGYSFGQRGDTFDDGLSYDFLVCLVKRRPCPVLVVSPNPSELVERLQDRLSTYRVFGIDVRWEIFSAILLGTIRHSCDSISRWGESTHRRLLYDYEASLNRL